MQNRFLNHRVERFVTPCSYTTLSNNCIYVQLCLKDTHVLVEVKVALNLVLHYLRINMEASSVNQVAAANGINTLSNDSSLPSQTASE